MLLDLGLGSVKLLAGNLANSHALIADGIHSLSDAITDVFVLVVTRISSHAPDSNHPYGHARFETLGTTLLGSSLIAIAVILAYNYLSLLSADRATQVPSWPALLVALFSIIAKEWIFHYTRQAGKSINSNLLIANAWHSRSDALSSVIVLIGIGASMLAAPWVDIAAAFVVSLIIGKIGLQLVWDNLKELVDTGLGEPEQQQIKETLLKINGIINVHDLRTRRMGQNILLDMHLQVASDISVSEGHNIGEWAARELLSQFDSINDVIYHIDVEDDHEARLSPNNALLPLRHEVVMALEDCWVNRAEINRVTLHYLNNRVDLELHLQCQNSCTQEIKQQLTERRSDYPWLGKVSIWCNTNEQ